MKETGGEYERAYATKDEIAVKWFIKKLIQRIGLVKPRHKEVTPFVFKLNDIGKLVPAVKGEDEL
jgi:hypothetical protein